MSSKRQKIDEASCSYPPPPLTASYVYVENKAKEILETPEVTGIAKLVTNLCHGKETEESPSSKLLYESFIEHFPNLLVVKLHQVYRFASVTPKIRSYSLVLLEFLLIYLYESRIDIERESLEDIRTHLNSCLFDEQEISNQDFKLLSRIVDRVSFYIDMEDISLDELCSHIISLNMNQTALLTFSQWPMVIDEEFLIPLLENDLHVRIIKRLLNPDSEEEWLSALEAGFSLILQLVDKERDHLISDLVYATVKSVWEMVNVRGREIVVRQGFVRIAKKVRKEAIRFREAEYEVVSRLVLMLKKTNGIGELTEMVAKMIHDLLDKDYETRR